MIPTGSRLFPVEAGGVGREAPRRSTLSELAEPVSPYNEADGGGGQNEVLLPAVGSEMTRRKSSQSRLKVEICKANTTALTDWIGEAAVVMPTRKNGYSKTAASIRRLPFCVSIKTAASYWLRKGLY